MTSAPPTPPTTSDETPAEAGRVPLADSGRAPLWVARVRRLLLLLSAPALALALTSFVWLDVWRGLLSGAIDGSGHHAAARIYDDSIFPETFGWTGAYFAGMPFPNFYPPLFFWCVSLLSHTHLVSFLTAFKLVLLLSLYATPAAVWVLAWVLSRRDELVATCASLSVLPLFAVGEVFLKPSGLDVSSTLLSGFYTQPLGFVMLLVWLVCYLRPAGGPWRWVAPSALLALTVLSNFFNAVTSVLFIATTLVADLWRWRRAADPGSRAGRRSDFYLHLFSPFIAAALTAFWLVPLLAASEYVVTRPYVEPLSRIAEPVLAAWYVLAAIGTALWLRRPTPQAWPYAGATLLLGLGLLLSEAASPRWFPFQSFRFLATLNFLLAVPVGVSVAFAVRLYLRWRGRGGERREGDGEAEGGGLRGLVLNGALGLVVVAVFAGLMATRTLQEPVVFYTPETIGRIRGVLEFAHARRDGRYLVEVPLGKSVYAQNRPDALAIGAHLGAQGNETVSVVYREAAPNASFFNAEVNAFSTYRENFGISSALMDDLDFLNQPLATHLNRLSYIGVRYLVIATPRTRERLAAEPAVRAQHDFGAWSVFELGPVPPKARALAYRPALFVGGFTLKSRRADQYDFVRLAEEQFSTGRFEVLLARSGEKLIDRLQGLEGFGALVLDEYECADEEAAFAALKAFAQERTLILLSSDAPLYRRLRSALGELPRAFVVERQHEPSGPWIEAVRPSRSYGDNPVRRVWAEVSRLLDEHRVAVAAPPAEVGYHAGPRRVDLSYAPAAAGPPIPVLLSMSFHPSWQRSDGGALYAATPFFTLAFVDRPLSLTFERSAPERLALWASAATLLGLGAFALWSYGRGRRR